mmetsp:Transcript_5392/g.15660  ORF Transcript_5392/g.15660 Transcript_5392/m.15660 type:complete len:82 (-) Transcript_5392:917-1162(-)
MRLRIFKGDVFKAHHRFATFPSNRPRSNGNMRRTTCSNRSSGIGVGVLSDGGYFTNGSHKTKKVNNTTPPSHRIRGKNHRH